MVSFTAALRKNIIFGLFSVAGALAVALVILGSRPPQAELAAGSLLVIDDGDAGFSVSPGWYRFSNGYQGDVRYNYYGNGSEVAAWRFSNLSPGTYRVVVTWKPVWYLSKDATYRILGDGREQSSVRVNQETAPQGGGEYGGVPWQKLGMVTIEGNTLTVELSDRASDPYYVFADAVGIERIEHALFTAFREKSLQSSQSLPLPSFVSEREVKVDRALLASSPDRVVIRVDDNAVTEYAREPRAGSAHTWVGRADGNPLYPAILTMKNDIVVGTILTPDGRTFEVRYSRGRQWLIETDHARAKIDGDDIAPTGPGEEVPQPREPFPLPSDAEGEGAGSISVMVLYTPKAREANAGTGDGEIGKMLMEVTALSDIDTANFIFKNSDGGARLEMAHIQEVDYEESSSDLRTDLNFMKSRDDVRYLRNLHLADLVVLYVSSDPGSVGNLCGMAGLPDGRPVSQFSEKEFVSVVNLGCSSTRFTFAHEIGHTLGAGHEKEDDEFPKQLLDPWSYGYFLDGKFSTVMVTYPGQTRHCPGGCDRIPYFSNPDVLDPGFGVPVGMAGDRDNARTIRFAENFVRNYRNGITPFITTKQSDIPDGLKLSPYSFRLSAVHGDGTYFWELQSGSLPTGVTLGRDGLVSGTPAVAGFFDFTVTVRDGAGNSDSKFFTISLRNRPGFTNTGSCLDVSGDGLVTSMDALRVINYVNLNDATQKLSTLEDPWGIFDEYGYIDVNGDDYAVAMDALAVINAINVHDFQCPFGH